MNKGNITLTMIKPEAVRRGVVGAILGKIEEAGFKIIALRYVRLTRSQAERFYAVHRERPFFESLVQYMCSAPIITAILKKENAVDDFRRLIGATNPEEAADGTIRKLYGENIQRNAVHGSDSDENARIEAGFHFAETDRFDC